MNIIRMYNKQHQISSDEYHLSSGSQGAGRHLANAQDEVKSSFQC